MFVSGEEVHYRAKISELAKLEEAKSNNAEFGRPYFSPMHNGRNKQA